MVQLKPLILHGHNLGPNPWKVAIILEELGLPYEHLLLEFTSAKSESFVALNPNGRFPALEDPNHDIVLWESGAIIEYLIATYDTDAKLHYTTFKEKFQTLSWVHFQMSGQGPYFGQRIWFDRYHPEKIPSAIARYANEMKRVISVIDSHLKKQGTQYLVGNEVTYADLMFIPWTLVIPGSAPEVDLSEFKHHNEWFKRITERPAVVKVLKDKEDAKPKA